LLWLNFIALWVRVYEITTLRDVTDTVSYLGNLIAAYGLLVTVWVLHNIRIYRKKGPRLRARAVAFSGTHDCLNQQIRRPSDLAREQEIVVDVSQGQKVFAGGSSSPDAPVLTETSV
jgi:hypothetical protein